MQSARAIWTFTLGLCTRAFVMAGFLNESHMYVAVSDDPVITFLAIELETCGFVRWCTINVTVTPPANQPCCQGCACDHRCELSDRCCPDYDFGNQTDFVPYTNVPDFVEEFLNWKATSNNHGEQLEVHNDHKWQCTRAQVRERSRDRDDGVGAFYMVAKCPPRDEVNVRTQMRCEFDYHDTIDRGEEPASMLSFANLVPIRSLVDGRLYKNSQCLACSLTGNDANAASWAITLVCSKQQMIIPYYEHFASPNSLLYAIAHDESRLEGCNVIFEPDSDHADTTPNQKCTRINNEQCPNNNTTDSELCMRYVAPVYHYPGVNNNRVTYKNSACVACNNIDTDFTSMCYTFNHIRRLALRLNVPGEMASMDVTEQLVDLLHVRFLGEPRHGCTAGHVYDRLADACRKMYCPLGMFAFQGECHSFFGRVEGGVFSVILRVVPISPAPNLTDVAFAVYNHTILMADNNNLIQIKAHGVFSSGQTKLILALYFTVDENKGTFSDAIKFTNSLVKSPWPVNTETSTPMVNMALADSIILNSRRYIDLRNGDKYTKEYPKMRMQSMSKYSILEITEENFCYRVLLFEHEFTRVDYSTRLVISSSGESVYQYTTPYDNYNVLVCTSHVIDSPSETMPNHEQDINIPTLVEQGGNVLKLVTPKTQLVEDDESVIEAAIAPLLMGLTVALAVGIAMIRRRLTESVLQQENTP